MKDTKNNTESERKNEHTPVVCRKPTRRDFLIVSGLAFLDFAATACKKRISPLTETMTRVAEKISETPISNQNTVIPAYKEPNATTSATVQEITKTVVPEPAVRKDTPILPNTPTLVDTEIPTSEPCPDFDKIREILKAEGIGKYKSISVLSETGLEEVSGYDESKPASKNDLETTRTSYQYELADTMTKFINANAHRDSQGKLKENVQVVLPNFINDIEGFKTIVSGNLPNFEFPSNINVTGYKSGVDIAQDAFLLSVHQGKKVDNEPSTFKTAIWKNAKVELSGDSYWVNGLLLGFRNDENKGTILETIPAQRYPGESRAQIVIYKGCEPLIVKTDSKDNVLGLSKLESKSDQSSGQEYVWVDLEGKKSEKSPEEVAISLGYEKYDDFFIDDRDTGMKMLESTEGGIKAYFHPTEQKWHKTEGWGEAMLKDPILNWWGTSYLDRVFEYSEELHTHSLRGVTDGVAVENPYEILTVSGQELAENVLSYNIYFLTPEEKLWMITVPLMVKLPDGNLFASDGSAQGDVMDNYGNDATQEEMKESLKITRSMFESLPGRIVSMNFYSDSESIDAYVKDMASKGRSFVEPYASMHLDLMRQYVEGRENELKKFVETGETELKYIVNKGSTSAFYKKDPDIVKLP